MVALPVKRDFFLRWLTCLQKLPYSTSLNLTEDLDAQLVIMKDSRYIATVGVVILFKAHRYRLLLEEAVQEPMGISPFP